MCRLLELVAAPCLAMGGSVGILTHLPHLSGALQDQHTQRELPQGHLTKS